MGCHAKILEGSIYDRQGISFFSGKFGLNYQIYLNMLNSMVAMFTISVLHRKYSFSANLV